jgi:hypothetical protein
LSRRRDGLSNRIENRTFDFLLIFHILQNYNKKIVWQRRYKRAFDIGKRKIQYKVTESEAKSGNQAKQISREFREAKNLIERSNNRTIVGKHSPAHKLLNKNRPFWLPVANFYVLAAAVAIAVFFISWAVLNAGEEEMPLISAGLLASAILAGAVVLREVIIRSARYRVMLAQERIDRNVKIVQRQNNLLALVKMTIEENNRILKRILERSQAADNSGKSSESHRQIFELCHEMGVA